MSVNVIRSFVVIVVFFNFCFYTPKQEKNRMQTKTTTKMATMPKKMLVEHKK